jgi:O-acetyl-ADP-ribose deacetylase (regulator of RNase III)
MELGGSTSAKVIRQATSNSLRVAEELHAESLALVAFGTGVGGFPLDEAAAIEVEEVTRHIASGSGLGQIIFAVRDQRAKLAFEEALASD